MISVFRSSPSSTFYDGLDQLTTEIAAFEMVHLHFCNTIVVFLLISVVILEVELYCRTKERVC
jgi:hypothetical protein